MSAAGRIGEIRLGCDELAKNKKKVSNFALKKVKVLVKYLLADAETG